MRAVKYEFKDDFNIFLPNRSKSVLSKLVQFNGTPVHWSVQFSTILYYP